jgi:Fic family protein
MYIGIAIGFVFGFLISFAMHKRGASAPWSPERARELGDKGRKSIAARIVRRKDRIVKFAQKKREVRIDDVEDLFCISDDTAGEYLRELAQEGRLRRVGSGKSLYYESIS